MVSSPASTVVFAIVAGLTKSSRSTVEPSAGRGALARHAATAFPILHRIHVRSHGTTVRREDACCTGTNVLPQTHTLYRLQYSSALCKCAHTHTFTQEKQDRNNAAYTWQCHPPFNTYPRPSFRTSSWCCTCSSGRISQTRLRSFSNRAVVTKRRDSSTRPVDCTRAA